MAMTAAMLLLLPLAAAATAPVAARGADQPRNGAAVAAVYLPSVRRVLIVLRMGNCPDCPSHFDNAAVDDM
jgi:hypothetical protein